MKRFTLIGLFALCLVPALRGTAAAGVFEWDVTGPAEVMQGNSIELTLSVTADGAWNIDHGDPTFTVDTDYEIGGASSDPVTLTGPTYGSTFTRTERYNSQGKRIPDWLGGTGEVTLTLWAPPALPPGDYDVVITPSVGVAWGTVGKDSMVLEPANLAFTVTVTQAAIAPIVTILSPKDGSKWLYQSDIPVSIHVDDQGFPLIGDPVATLDGEVSVALALDAEGNWAGVIVGLLPGPHVLTASATNAGGTTTAESCFSVYLKFGQWLPPISLDKPHKSGSTLPVKFTILGALGPVDIAYPHVLLDGVDLGEAEVLYDSGGLPYYQLGLKVPAPGTHSVTVTEENMDEPPSVSKAITAK